MTKRPHFTYKPLCSLNICREVPVNLQKGPCQHKIFSNKPLKAQIAFQTLSKAQITASGPLKITNKSLKHKKFTNKFFQVLFDHNFLMPSPNQLKSVPNEPKFNSLQFQIIIKHIQVPVIIWNDQNTPLLTYFYK